jgi:hypothetical protein
VTQRRPEMRLAGSAWTKQQDVGAPRQPGIAAGKRGDMSMADHRNGGKIEAAERLSRWQARLQQMSLDTSLSALGKFELGKSRQESRGGPALTVGTLGECLPLFAECGQAQFTQQQRQTRSIDGDLVQPGGGR